MEKPIKQLFIDFIANNCSPQEIDQVHGILQQGLHETEWQQAMEETEALQAGKDDTGNSLNESLLFKRIQKTAGIHSPFTQRFVWLGYAALFLVVISFGLFFLKSATPSKTAAVTVLTKGNTTAADKNHKWIKLADGTSVQLNINSHLDYPATFAGTKTREVTLSGEAYFDVKHDARHPFIIHTGKIRTTVLGTAFNISAYKANTGVTVTVTRGKVIVQNDKETLAILTPDQQLIWKSTVPSIKTIVKAESVITWNKDDLIMDDITLSEAAKMITSRYGLEVKFSDDKVRDNRFTAAFLNRNDINQVMTVIQEITGTAIVLKGQVITISNADQKASR